MKNKRNLSYEERYILGYMEGFRIGKIEASREMLIRCLCIKGKEQNLTPNKKLIIKINREIDTMFLNEILYDVMKDKLSVMELEFYYDSFFLIPNDGGKMKSLWRSPFVKENITDSEKRRNEPI